MKSFPFYKQPDVKDCDPTCLRTVAKHYGKLIYLQEIRYLFETTRAGSNLLKLSDAAEGIGFKTIGVKIDYNKLLDGPLRLIVHLNKKHCVVVYKIKKDEVYISDPAYGLISYSKNDFIARWIGNNASETNRECIAMLLRCTPRFKNLKWEDTNKKSLKFLFQHLWQYKNLLTQICVGLLAVIKNTARLDDVFMLKQLIDSTRITEDPLGFPIDRAWKLMLGEIGPTYINFEKSYIDYSLYHKLRPFDNRLNGERNSLEEVRIRLKSQMSQKEVLEQEFVLKEKEFARFRTLYQKGVISQQEYESKEIDFLQMQKNSINISISQMREAISMADHSLKSTYIDKSEIETWYRSNLVYTFHALERTVRDWEYKYVLLTSAGGIVSFQGYWGTNQQVDVGDVVFSVLPAKEQELIGKLTFSSQNAGKVLVGQKVLVRVDNYPYQQYGMLTGNVANVSISPDAEGNYIVYIFLPSGLETSYNIRLDFNQELLGITEIIMEDLSVAERSFYKFRELFKY